MLKGLSDVDIIRVGQYASEESFEVPSICRVVLQYVLRVAMCLTS